MLNRPTFGGHIKKVDLFFYALNHLPALSGKPDGFDEEIFDLLFSSASPDLVIVCFALNEYQV